MCDVWMDLMLGSQNQEATRDDLNQQRRQIQALSVKGPSWEAERRMEADRQ